MANYHSIFLAFHLSVVSCDRINFTCIYTLLLSPELLQIDAHSVMDEETLHAQCRADYSQLKEEYERYKLRAQSVLKNKSTKVIGPFGAIFVTALLTYCSLDQLPSYISWASLVF